MSTATTASGRSIEPVFQRLGLAAACLLIGGLSLVGCGPLASKEALEWCSLHQTEVALTALDLGLMERGTDFTEWKLSDTDGYNRACIQAFEEAE